MDTSNVVLKADVKTINQRGFDVVRQIDGKSPHEARRNIITDDKYNDYVNRQSAKRSFGIGASVVNLMYHKNTDILTQLNESWNTNRFINTGLTKEKARLGKDNKVAMVDIYKMRQEELQLEFSRFFYECMIRIVLATIIALSAIMALSSLRLQNKIGIWLAGVLIITICFLYAGALIIMIRQLSRRRIMDWQRYYWKKGPIKEDVNACVDRPSSST
jgi:hypothetical protein